jgi:hypothetical protein
MSVSVKVKRLSRVYFPGVGCCLTAFVVLTSQLGFLQELVQGVVVVQSKGSMSHNGIKLQASGRVKLLNSGKVRFLFLLRGCFLTSLPKDQAMVESVQLATDPRGIFFVSIDVAGEGKVPNGTTEIPFEFVLAPVEGGKLYETYHGVYVNIQYSIDVDIARGFLSRDMNAKTEFLVQIPPEASKKRVKPPQQVPFDIVPESLENLKSSASVSRVPRFKVVGHLDSAICDITRPLSGEVKVFRVYLGKETMTF